jgi:flagellar protein FlaI
MPEPGEGIKAKTVYDQVFDAALQLEKPFPVKELQNRLNIDDSTFREILDVFTNSHVFEIKQDKIVRVEPPYGLVRYEAVGEGKVIEEREFEWKSIKFHVKIIDIEKEMVPFYYVPPFKLGNGLRAKLKSIFLNLTSMGGKKPLEGEYERPMDLSKHLAAAAIEKELKTQPDISDRLSDILVYEFSEVGCLNIFLQDEDIEEIVFNGPDNAVSLYSRKYGWMKTNVYPVKEESVFEIATRMVRLVQKEFNFSNPLVETRLPTGDRVSALLNTISPQGTLITIRKFSRNPWTITGLIKRFEATDIDVAALLWFAVEYDLNILLAGGSGSGKTTLLNAVCSLIPPSLHVLSIENVREIHIPESRAWNWLSLVSKDESETAGIDTTHLMEISLKMRPERIILGEAVHREDIKSLFQAMSVGHPVYSTIHATSSKELIRRVLDPAYNVPRTDINSLDLVLVMYHDLKEKKRKLVEVSEVRYDNPSLDLDIMDIISNIYRYSPRTESYVEISKPKKIFEKVSVKTGMSEKGMWGDIEEKKRVLQWALDNNMLEMQDLEPVVQDYYTDRKALLGVIEGSPNQ